MQRHCGNKADWKDRKREGTGESPWSFCREPLPALPGKTGTGAPVTERLRCLDGDELGWYRDFHVAPMVWGRHFSLREKSNQ